MVLQIGLVIILQEAELQKILTFQLLIRVKMNPIVIYFQKKVCIEINPIRNFILMTGCILYTLYFDRVEVSEVIYVNKTCIKRV